MYAELCIYHHISRLWFGYKHTKPLLFFPPSNFPHDVSVVMAWTVSNCTTWIWGCSNMCTFRICRSIEMFPWCLVHLKMPWIRDIPCSDTSVLVTFASRSVKFRHFWSTPDRHLGKNTLYATDLRCTMWKCQANQPCTMTMQLDLRGWSNFFGFGTFGMDKHGGFT